MKQSIINKAYPALMRLCELKLPIKKAREIYNLSVKLGQYFEFALAEEQKSVSECNGKVNPDGTVSFSTQEDYAVFQTRMDELNNSEVEWIIDLIILSEGDVRNQSISPADIHSLENFVAFE